MFTLTIPDAPISEFEMEALYGTREAWLRSVAVSTAPIFERAGAKLPEKIRFTVSWPGGTRGTFKSKQGVIGQCWYRPSSTGGFIEICISPTIDNPLQVAATLVHELVHACLGAKAGHGPKFRKLALGVGLAGQMTATHASPELIAELAPILEMAGPYPHARMTTEGEAADKPKKQAARMLKVSCPECADPYICRMSATTISRGLPTCPCGAEMVADAATDGE